MLSVSLCDLCVSVVGLFLKQIHHRDTENLHRGTEVNLFPTDS